MPGCQGLGLEGWERYHFRGVFFFGLKKKTRKSWDICSGVFFVSLSNFSFEWSVWNVSSWVVIDYYSWYANPPHTGCVWYVKCLMFRCFQGHSQNTKPCAATRPKTQACHHSTNIPSTTKSPKSPYLQKRLDLRNQLPNMRIEIIYPPWT